MIVYVATNFPTGRTRGSIAPLSQTRRRGVHRAVVDLLLEGGDPTPAALPLIASHALAAGDTERAARLSIDAARAALQANAAEEALRLIEQALPTVTSSQDRRDLLCLRDDAYAVSRNTTDRLEGLAELSALALRSGRVLRSWRIATAPKRGGKPWLDRNHRRRANRCATSSQA